MLNQNQIKNIYFDTVTAAKAAGRPKEVCFVVETSLWYIFIVAGSVYTANDIDVLTTSVGGNTKWVAINRIDLTSGNASTINHGLLLKATAPESGLRNIVAIDNTETVYTNKALFDAIVPSTQAFSDSAAAGSAMVAARRDHKHAMPAASNSLSRVNKTHSDSPYTVTASDCDGTKVFTNTGATAECILNLPAGADGYRINMLVTAAYDYTSMASGSEKIRFLATESKAGGKIKSRVIGHLLQLDWSGTQWVSSITGDSWQLETS